MEWYKVAFGELYPLLYSHRDDAEAEGAVARLAPLLAGRGAVLDVACGAGRYLAAFTRAGLEAFGLDLSEFLLIEAAERRSLGDRLVLADMRTLPVRNASVGVVTNMFTSFGYFETDGDDLRVVREVSRVLVPGGLFLLDYLNGTTVARDLVADSTREVEGAVVHERRWLDDAHRVLHKDVRVELADRRDVAFSERVRLYSADDFTAMLDEAGLGVRAVYGSYDLDAFDAEQSPRLIVLGEKRRRDAR